MSILRSCEFLHFILIWLAFLVLPSNMLQAQGRESEYEPEAITSFIVKTEQKPTVEQLKSHIKALMHSSWPVEIKMDYERMGNAGYYALFYAVIEQERIYGLDIKVSYYPALSKLTIHLPERFKQPFHSEKPWHNAPFLSELTIKPMFQRQLSKGWLMDGTTLRNAIVEQKAQLGSNCEDYSQFIFKDGSVKTIQHVVNKHVAPQDTPVYVTIFYPDPVTSGLTTYGGNYVDNNNADNPTLTNELLQDTIYAKFSETQFTLEDSNFVVGEFSPPVKSVCITNSPIMSYTRGHEYFEQINVFYHLQKFKRYLDQHGYENLPGFKVKIDANALNGADQSAFLPNMKTLLFGEGNVDDGEDADVILHEYAHALSHGAAPGTNQGAERRCIEEGIADFFAASYSKRISEFRWEYLFSWDGNNEFWPGRRALNGKIYPSSMTGNHFQDGEILCNALCNLFNFMPHAKVDQLVWESLYALRPNMTMSDYLNSLLDADSVLNNAQNVSFIQFAFALKGVESIITSNDHILNAQNNQYKSWHLYEGSLHFDIGSKVVSVLVYDLQGKLLSEHRDLPHNRFELRKLHSGICHLHVKYANGQSDHIRIQKR